VITGEFSYAAVTRAPTLEVARIRDAVWSGVGLPARCVLLRHHLRRHRARQKGRLQLLPRRHAGEATRKIVQNLDQPMQCRSSSRRPTRAREGGRLLRRLEEGVEDARVQSYDRDVDPQKARELGVSGNGIVVVARGGHREQLSVGLELEGARTQLRNLDRDVQTRLLKWRGRRNVYFVTGTASARSTRSTTPTSARRCATCARC